MSSSTEKKIGLNILNYKVSILMDFISQIQNTRTKTKLMSNSKSNISANHLLQMANQTTSINIIAKIWIMKVSQIKLAKLAEYIMGKQVVVNLGVFVN